MARIRINRHRRAEIGRTRRARTRACLVEAARRVLAEKGPDAPMIDDFIAEAAVARGTFYNYFKAREDVIQAVAQDVLDSLSLEIAAMLRGIKDPAERIARIVSYCIRKAGADPVWGRLMVRMVSSGPYLGNAMHREFVQDLKSGLASGRLSFESMPAALDLVKGTSIFAMRSMARGMESQTHAEQVAALTLCSLGLSRREATALAQRSFVVSSSPVRRPRWNRAHVSSRAKHSGISSPRGRPRAAGSLQRSQPKPKENSH